MLMAQPPQCTALTTISRRLLRPGGAGDQGAEVGDGGDRREFGERPAFADDLDHLVHKTIEADGDGG
jgi:hypothetical protein